jgi:hypothetical protein
MVGAWRVPPHRAKPVAEQARTRRSPGIGHRSLRAGGGEQPVPSVGTRPPPSASTSLLTSRSSSRGQGPGYRFIAELLARVCPYRLALICSAATCSRRAAVAGFRDRLRRCVPFCSIADNEPSDRGRRVGAGPPAGVRGCGRSRRPACSGRSHAAAAVRQRRSCPTVRAADHCWSGAVCRVLEPHTPQAAVQAIHTRVTQPPPRWWALECRRWGVNSGATWGGSGQQQPRPCPTGCCPRGGPASAWALVATRSPRT